MRHVVIGLVKAPVFALVIAIIGCRMGMDVRRDTSAIGTSTTSTVVQCIVAVILINAAFAIVLQQLGL
jgi:phospholipid/cholesterol/gamma-HCH transport system permease protein